MRSVHQVIICNTQAARQAVINGPSFSATSDWVVECEKMAKDWIDQNGRKIAGPFHVSNGNLYAWVED